jgi:hypothetical protein
MNPASLGPAGILAILPLRPAATTASNGWKGRIMPMAYNGRNRSAVSQ